MHPGPVNRGVEICDLAMDYERCLINRQVETASPAACPSFTISLRKPSTDCS